LIQGAVLEWQGRLDEAEPWIQRAERSVPAEAEPAAGRRSITSAGCWSSPAEGSPTRWRPSRPPSGRPGASPRRISSWRGPGPGSCTLWPAGRDRAWQVFAGLSDQDREQGEIRVAAAALLRPPLEPLSQCELRILRYLPTNLTAPEIAAELSVSQNTVKPHLRNLYAKLGTHRRADAVACARGLGLLAPRVR
jgi:DNA-binding CsgD family transcriptional regulator